MYTVAQKNGATGHPISLQIFRKLHDRIAWKLVDFRNIYMLNTVINFLFKNFIALWRHTFLWLSDFCSLTIRFPSNTIRLFWIYAYWFLKFRSTISISKCCNILLSYLQATANSMRDVMPGYVGAEYDAAAWQSCIGGLARKVLEG